MATGDQIARGRTVYEFTGTKLEQFPLPGKLPLEFGRELDGLAQKLASLEPSAVCADGVPTREQAGRGADRA